MHDASHINQRKITYNLVYGTVHNSKILLKHLRKEDFHLLPFVLNSGAWLDSLLLSTNRWVGLSSDQKAEDKLDEVSVHFPR